MTLKFNPFTNRLDITETGGGGGGDVSGPGSSTDNAIVRWDGVSGTLIQNSVATLSDTGDILANSIDLTVPLDELDGGTAQSSYTTGDILYASGINTLSKLPIGNASDVLTVSGGLPAWVAGGGGGGVTSVSGTANRITSTGGATPVIDISGSYVGQASITTLGTIGTGTWNGSIIALAYGGTNANLTASDGGIFYSTAAAGAILSGTATANKVLMSGSSTAPTWSTPTFPNVSATSGKFIRSDGTNWIASTPTLPTSAGTSGKVLQSDGTNYVESTPTYPSTSGSSGKILISDGTNNVYSTPTYPNIATGTGKILRADGTNWAASTATYPDTATGTGTILRADGTNWVASTATYPNTTTTGDLLYGSASNVYSNLAVSTIPGIPLGTDGTNPLYLDPAQYIYIHDEMFGGVANYAWNNPTVNAGTQVNTTTAANPGQIAASTGTNTNGGAGMRFQSSDTCFIFSGGRIILNMWAQLSALSDGTDTYIARIGFGDGAGSTDAVDGAYFEYTHSVNSGNWTIKTANNSTRTTNNTSTAADTNWNKFTVDVNAGGTSVAYYINGSEVANSPITTNIPTGAGRGFTIWYQIIKSAGTTARTFNCDLVTCYQKLTVSR